MKRERIFYLDFIRALAVILILLTHYNALFLYMDPQPLDKVVITYKICNLYIGDSTRKDLLQFIQCSGLLI